MITASMENEANNRLVAELEEKVQSLLTDNLLKDVTSDTTLEELNTLIAIERGNAYRIQIDRGPLEPLCQASTVNDIKKLIQVKLERMHKHGKHISCQRLLDDQALVSELGIRQNSVLKFTRLAFEKGKHRRAWHWYNKRARPC
ncbi:hypothetical protein EC973_000293 [Apophysomyces ossiformis]|uniref:SNRNP25 ubiquitin-like domain-containing protein n=1 Tax=Apophysomyces ossiformis TaxID=679940 RepID=A0A8H7BV93_9FUNG|nr:hypothetical protein EC973_000293 [Apophysomyces ossiformis]